MYNFSAWKICMQTACTSFPPIPVAGIGCCIYCLWIYLGTRLGMGRKVPCCPYSLTARDAFRVSVALGNACKPLLNGTRIAPSGPFSPLEYPYIYTVGCCHCLFVCLFFSYTVACSGRWSFCLAFVLCLEQQ